MGVVEIEVLFRQIGRGREQPVNVQCSRRGHADVRHRPQLARQPRLVGQRRLGTHQRRFLRQVGAAAGNGGRQRFVQPAQDEQHVADHLVRIGPTQ